MIEFPLTIWGSMRVKRRGIADAIGGQLTAGRLFGPALGELLLFHQGQQGGNHHAGIIGFAQKADGAGAGDGVSFLAIDVLH